MLTFLANNVGSIAAIISAVLTFAGVVVTVFTKNKKAGKLLVVMGNVIRKLPTLIKTAEQLGGDGATKKAYVMEQVELYFRACGITPSPKELETISAQVDDEVKLTKELHNGGMTSSEKDIRNVYR